MSCDEGILWRTARVTPGTGGFALRVALHPTPDKFWEDAFSRLLSTQTLREERWAIRRRGVHLHVSGLVVGDEFDLRVLLEQLVAEANEAARAPRIKHREAVLQRQRAAEREQAEIKRREKIARSLAEQFQSYADDGADARGIDETADDDLAPDPEWPFEDEESTLEFMEFVRRETRQQPDFLDTQ
jgi:hypothetical protein